MNLETSLSGKKLKYCIVASAAITIFGFILFIIFGRVEYKAAEFWSIYKVASGGTGLMLAIFGAIWLLLCLLHLLTNFFDTSARMDADKFVFSMIIIIVVVGGLLLLTLPKLPEMSLDKLPKDAERRAKIQRMESNFRVLVAGVVACCGIAAASIPCRRFLMMK
jgi:heme/copper-type cytochrome/quinol oxidase subunit 4